MTARTASIIGSNVGKLQDTNVRKLKSLYFETAATVDAGDTLDINYARYGITTVQSVQGWRHTTDNSVIVIENPTTKVTSSVMRLTYPAGADNDKRVTQIYYI